MKYIVAALMCGLLSLTLTGCQQSGTADVSISPAASSVQPVSSAPTASSTEPVNSAPDSIRIQLTRVEEQLTDADGQVLVEYAYDRPTVTISGNPTGPEGHPGRSGLDHSDPAGGLRQGGAAPPGPGRPSEGQRFPAPVLPAQPVHPAHR